MNTVCLSLALTAALACFATGADPVLVDAPSPDASWSNDFSNPKTLDDEWKFDGGRFLVPRTKFALAAEPTASNGKIMAVEADKSTGVMLSAPSKVDLTKTPVMRWRWRVTKPITLKPGECEPDDQAVVLYFGDGTLLKQRCVGYRWEVNTPLEHNGLRKYSAGTMTVSHRTVRNNTTPAGEWVVEERNVVEDYRKAFGKMPNDEFIISVGANSQYSGSSSRAEIDFIEFIPERKKTVATITEPAPKADRKKK